MAAIIIKVTEARAPRLNIVSHSGRRVFHVYFKEYTTYLEMINACDGATDPETGLRIPREKEGFDGGVWKRSERPENNEGNGGEAATGPVCDDIDVELFEEQNMIFKVTCNFSAFEDDPNDEESKDPTNPTQPTPVIYPWQRPKGKQYTHANVQQIMTIDLDGNPIVNSAGEQFDTAITVPMVVRQYTETWATKIGGFNEAAAAREINTVSNSDKRLCTAHDGVTAFFTDPNSGNEIQYWNVTRSYSIITSTQKHDTWQGKIQDRGLVDSEGQQIKTKDGNPVVASVRLNGSGEPLINPADGSSNPLGGGGTLKKISALSSVDTGVWLEYKKYR